MSIAKKQLKWVGKVVRMDSRQIPPKILTCFIRKARCSGRRHLNTNLCLLIPALTDTGDLGEWKRWATHEGYWNKCINAMMSNDELPSFNENHWWNTQHNNRNRNRDTNQSNDENSDSNRNNFRKAQGSEHNDTNHNNQSSGNRNRSNIPNPQLNSPNTNELISEPSFFLRMSHIHTIQSARRCLQVNATHIMREITLRYYTKDLHVSFTLISGIQT